MLQGYQRNVINHIGLYTVRDTKSIDRSNRKLLYLYPKTMVKFKYAACVVLSWLKVVGG